VAAQIRTRAGECLASPALIADGNHARVDSYVSLAVVATAAFVALGLPIADPLIGLAITAVILKITWDRGGRSPPATVKAIAKMRGPMAWERWRW